MKIETKHNIEKILKAAEVAETPGPPASCRNCYHIRKDAPWKFVLAGKYQREVDKSVVQRYRCCGCGATYSDATESLAYKQQRRDINLQVFLSLSSLLSLRRIALQVAVSRDTIERRLAFFEKVSRHAHDKLLTRLIESDA